MIYAALFAVNGLALYLWINGKEKIIKRDAAWLDHWFGDDIDNEPVARASHEIVLFALGVLFMASVVMLVYEGFK